ncbi:hypothetical protein HYO98_gp70 [Dinoroseobacter phage DS-1410Ws-06]|uniref:Uncharacterized protein n=1 Tax=Dinoroseobacter phage DS-1410Ws-06 TaxID=1815983 RepID=A0A191VYD2_9CAUD|nr:hypothetical protein HYO98_gp70 [Dinoroseobacter phage DS-1410Ws-06]ANJ20727.1 hypothetical protein DSp06_gp70 [Dinoroseobacter phage DS-1410Ws-06]
MSSQDPNLFSEVFNQRAALLTFFGALGGSVRAAVLKTTWREGLRVIFVGGAVAFGVGVLGPVVMRPWIGDLPDEMAGAMGTLTAASFLIGLVAVTLVERFISGEANEPVAPQPREYGPEGLIDEKDPEENQ